MRELSPHADLRHVSPDFAAIRHAFAADLFIAAADAAASCRFTLLIAATVCYAIRSMLPLPRATPRHAMFRYMMPVSPPDAALRDMLHAAYVRRHARC